MSAYQEFKKIFTKNSLKELFFKSIKFNSCAGIDGVSVKNFEKNLNENINFIFEKIHNGKYKFSKYKGQLLLKGHDSYPRLISIPTIRDKIVLRAIFLILSKTLPWVTPRVV